MKVRLEDKENNFHLIINQKYILISFNWPSRLLMHLLLSWQLHHPLLRSHQIITRMAEKEKVRARTAANDDDEAVAEEEKDHLVLRHRHRGDIRSHRPHRSQIWTWAITPTEKEDSSNNNNNVHSKKDHHPLLPLRNNRRTVRDDLPHQPLPAQEHLVWETWGGPCPFVLLVEHHHRRHQPGPNNFMLWLVLMMKASTMKVAVDGSSRHFTCSSNHKEDIVLWRQTLHRSQTEEGVPVSIDKLNYDTLEEVTTSLLQEETTIQPLCFPTAERRRTKIINEWIGRRRRRRRGQTAHQRRKEGRKRSRTKRKHFIWLKWHFHDVCVYQYFYLTSNRANPSKCL